MPHISGLTGGGTTIEVSALHNYGISRQRSGFSSFTEEAVFGDIDMMQVGSGLLHALATDLTRVWPLYYGTQIPLNTAAEVQITKSFFSEVNINDVKYTGSANYCDSNFGNLLGSNKYQHVLLVETTNEIEPNAKVNSGISQKYRIRFEFDERERLYSQDPEFKRELIQLNRRRQNKGLSIYATGNKVNEVDLDLYGNNVIGDDYTESMEGHPGYRWMGAVDSGVVAPGSQPDVNDSDDWYLGETLRKTFKINGKLSGNDSVRIQVSSIKQNVGYDLLMDHTSTLVTCVSSSGDGDVDASAETIVSALNNDDTFKLYFTASTDSVMGNRIYIENQVPYTSVHVTVEYVPDPNGGSTIAGYAATAELLDDVDGAVTGTVSPGWASYGVTGRTGFQNGYVGIPNPMYGWLKVNIATSLQLTDSGSIVMSESVTFDELSHAGGGVYVDGSVFRSPGELVDINFEDNIFPYINEEGGSQLTIKARNKRKLPGWVKRFPKLIDGGAYPMSYRLTITERGIGFSIWDDAGVDQNDDYAWFVSQRLVDNYTGQTRRDPISNFPVHCLYSCSRESLYPSDFGIYYSSAALDSHVPGSQLTQVHRLGGESIAIGSDAFRSSTSGQNAIILSILDREDYLQEEELSKKIWRFVVREYDTFKPWDVHKSATRHQTDSNAVINPMEQLAITDDNRFVITFPTGLTTQRVMYPKEEIDMVCFSSAEVVAEGSTVPMSSYNSGAVTNTTNETGEDHRRYYGLRSTLPNSKGMRVCMLVSGDWIFNTDVNLDVHGT